ncbi:MAG: outer membrane protein [Spirulinaceae cyanobacterium]
MMNKIASLVGFWGLGLILFPNPVAAEVHESQPVLSSPQIASDSINQDIYQEAHFLQQPLVDSGDVLESRKAQIGAPELLPEEGDRVGFYGSVSGDARFFNNVTINPLGVGIEVEPGFGINAAGGYKFENNLRLEGQFAYGRNEIGEVNLPGAAAVTQQVNVPLTIANDITVPAPGINVGGVNIPAGTTLPTAGTVLNPGNPQPTLANDLVIPNIGTIPAGTAIDPNVFQTAGGGTATNVVTPALAAATVEASGSISTTSLLFNAYYDIETESNFEPYIGAGVGVSWASANNLSATYPGTNTTFAIDDTAFGVVYQFMGGVAYYFNPQTAVTVGYRYLGVPERTFSAGTFGELKADGLGVHNLEVGIRYMF